MAKYGSPSIVIEIDSADGGSLVDITQYIQEFDGVKIERLMEEGSHSFGDSWFEALQSGMRRAHPVKLGGFYDDAASTGPDAIFVTSATHAVTRTFKVTWGGSKTTTVEVWITEYDRKPERGKLTRFEVMLLPTGAVTEA